MKYYIKVYNNDYFRIYSSSNKDKGLKRLLNFGNNSNSESASISRTKKNIRELCLCNDFKFFCTWTVNSKLCDRFSLSATQDLMRKTLKAYHRKNPDFKYIFITEKHKNGAFHFHGLIRGLLPQDIVTNKNFYLDVPFFSDRIGYFSCSPIRDYNKTCNYITKYITKDCIKNEHNQIYFCSKGLKKASVEELHNFNFQEFQEAFGGFSYSSEYSQCSDLHFSKLNRKQTLFFFNLY